VLLAEHWHAKVADFGTALTKYAGQAEGPAGTPPYMAPEAIALTSGAKAKPTDVWSFGCLLAHMGTRSIPYSHVQLPPKDTAHALMAIIVNGQATPLDQLRNVAGCPPGILALTTRCLQTDPGQRPTFPSIVDELQRIKGSVRASRPSAQLRRADAIGQAGATAAPTLISATYCAPTDTSATYCASTYTSATSIDPTYTSATYSAPMAPTYSSATLPALRYAVGSSVIVKRSNGAETLAYVKEYDAEMALYTVEIETLGSGQTEKCHYKDLRAANVGLIEGLIGSARAALLTLQAGGSLAA
jgi:serine/threonine protein kinase